MTDRLCGTCHHYSEASRPGESKTPARGGWCMAPIPSWARVAMDDARTLPTRGMRCPVWAPKIAPDCRLGKSLAPIIQWARTREGWSK